MGERDGVGIRQVAQYRGKESLAIVSLQKSRRSCSAWEFTRVADRLPHCLARSMASVFPCVAQPQPREVTVASWEYLASLLR